MAEVYELEKQQNINQTIKQGLMMLFGMFCLLAVLYGAASDSAYRKLLEECEKNGRVEQFSDDDTYAIKCEVFRVKTTKHDEKLIGNLRGE
ncbi:hypothetical protein PCIT_a3048 [Pseudoalteromonas citrea]|uniref:Uncharacterized protein n=2 Tax=Pseudoalteromonas citrea TaxID=43655 RepID=A0AAD4AI63_9GAMM|nr:hypothetical protein [Pseudoalteromonas citrea]KAF7770091.1 hypothetical protein PCIT_a3048 [Pseudoalteromonas citrea]